MKSFDRRSFGKLLLGAIPAVCLANKAEAGVSKPGHSNMVRSKEAEKVRPFAVDCNYMCGHSERLSNPPHWGDPWVNVPVVKDSTTHQVYFRFACPDCRQKTNAYQWLHEGQPLDKNALRDFLARF